jgi:DNA-binding response OmpR family regulator
MEKGRMSAHTVIEYVYERGDGKVFKLSGIPAKIMRLLMDNLDEMVSRERLIGRVWGIHESNITKKDLFNLNSHITRVNKFVDETNGHYILTRKNKVGVKLIENV